LASIVVGLQGASLRRLLRPGKVFCESRSDFVPFCIFENLDSDPSDPLIKGVHRFLSRGLRQIDRRQLSLGDPEDVFVVLCRSVRFSSGFFRGAPLCQFTNSLTSSSSSTLSTFPPPMAPVNGGLLAVMWGSRLCLVQSIFSS